MGRTSTKKPNDKVEIKTPEQLQQENQQLRFELDEIKKMLTNLTKEQNKENAVKKNNEKPVNNEVVFDDIQQEIEIRPNKYIKVISLTNGMLVLTTQPMGQGKEFRFNKFGETKNIIYSELTEILHCHQSFAEAGKFYIADKNVVFNHGLIEFYKKILTKDMIENLLEYSHEQVIDLFKSATQAQQETIVSIIANRIMNEQEVDLNKVNAISRVYGKDIIEMAQEAKSLFNAE